MVACRRIGLRSGATTLICGLLIALLLPQSRADAATQCGSAGYYGPPGCVLLSGTAWAPSLANLGDLNVYNNGTNLDYLGPDVGYSWQYQCTELAIRYAAVVWGEGSSLATPETAWRNAGWDGSAVDMWSVGPHLPVPLHQIPNGAGAPRFGDLIIFSGDTVGHVGVVVRVSAGRLYFVGENQSAAPAEAWIPISGNRASPGGDFSSTLQPIGWLRANVSGSWTANSAPIPAGDLAAAFGGISCPSTTFCEAVGGATVSSVKTLALAEQWNGTTWSIQPVPSIRTARTSELNSVSCTSSSHCLAVGDLILPSRESVAISFLWNGTNWVQLPTRVPTGSRQSQLSGVSCASPTSCFGVGYYDSRANKDEALTEAWSGTAWSLRNDPLTAGSASNMLKGVACTSSSNCIAVGQKVMGSSTQVALAQRWNGRRWIALSTVNFAGQLSPSLNGVSCSSAELCSAVGNVEAPSGRESTVVERWNGSAWSLEATPNTGGRDYRSLFGISCNSSTSCTAVGYFQNSEHDYVQLAEQWNGTTWAIGSVPSVSGTTYYELAGVACPSSCVAVGSGPIETSS